MDHKGDKHAYLRKSGMIPQQKCAVTAKAIGVKGSSRGKGSLGSASDESATPAKAKLEGGVKVTAEMKKSLKGLKGGGTEKELRDGHNSRGGMKTAPGMQTPKAKPEYNFNTNPIRAAKQDRREDIQAAKASGVKGAVKTAKAVAKTEMHVARGVRQARNKEGLRKADRAAGKAARMEARAKNTERKATGLASLV